MGNFSKIFITVLVLQIIAVYGHEQTKRLSAACLNRDGVLVPMPNSCTGFFICIDGTAIASSCGDYYHFNARSGFCDHPLRAGCFQSQLLAELAAHPPIIDEYTPIMPMLPVIVPPKKTVASTQATTNAGETSPAMPKPQHPDEVVADIFAGSICEKASNGVLLPKADSCSHFYVCILQRPYRRTCPRGKHFNHKLGICQDRKMAQCKAKFTSPMTVLLKPLKPKKLTKSTNQLKKTTEELIKSTVAICAGVADGKLLPYSGDCGKFLTCSHGRSMEMSCPTGLHFSVSLQRCEWPANANCSA